MPDTLNKQSLINLLIDSPLREPIKINLIDITNNTSEADLPKIYSTITKELEIFQKATERRMKLADETIAKLGGSSTSTTTTAPTTSPVADMPTAEPTPAALPPLDLPPLPQTHAAQPSPALSVPPLDLPPMPASTAITPTSEPVAALAPAAMPPMQPLGGVAPSSSSDEDALAEIQKELDSLKSTTATEISSVATSAAPTK